MLFSCECVTVVLEKMNNRLILQLGPYTAFGCLSQLTTQWCLLWSLGHTGISSKSPPHRGGLLRHTKKIKECFGRKRCKPLNHFSCSFDCSIGTFQLESLKIFSGGPSHDFCLHYYSYYYIYRCKPGPWQNMWMCRTFSIFHSADGLTGLQKLHSLSEWLET